MPHWPNGERILCALQLCRVHAPKDCGAGHCNLESVMLEAGMPASRLLISHHATDTGAQLHSPTERRHMAQLLAVVRPQTQGMPRAVTNFTTLMPLFKRRKYLHVLVVTSDYHAQRANAIATVLLKGSGVGELSSTAYG